jgi:hypothetical protein
MFLSKTNFFNVILKNIQIVSVSFGEILENTCDNNDKKMTKHMPFKFQEKNGRCMLIVFLILVNCILD